MAKQKYPAGMVRRTPIYVALRPDERKRVEETAAREGLSLSATVRRAVLRDLQQRRAREEGDSS